MGDQGQLTNVPDYQKIRQTSQGGAGSGGEQHSDWSEDVETLTPSPVVRPPKAAGITLTRPMPHPQYGGYGSWQGKPSVSPVVSGKASWEPQPKASWDGGSGQPAAYSPAKYGLMASSLSMSSIKEDPPYMHHGYSQPVSKYMDNSGVQRRAIRRTNASPPNRKSYTEGFMLRDSSEFSSFPEGSLIKSASQRNVSEGYGTRSTDSGYGDTVRSPRGGLSGKGSYSQSHSGAGSGDDQWKEIGGGNSHMTQGGGHMTTKHPQEDLRSWQQQHQEELLHQHLETQALYESPAPPSGQHLNTSFKQLTVGEEPPARWEPVRRAADNIIREKNMIIDKLKNRIMELEEDFRVSEGKLRQALASKEDDADLVKHKLQAVEELIVFSGKLIDAVGEQQHKTGNLRDQLSDERAKRNNEVEDLEVKLGSVEHEVTQLKDILRKKDVGAGDLRAELEDKTRETDAWRERFEESRASHTDMKKKLDSLQRYLDDLPTVEETRHQAQQILSQREENHSLKSRQESSEKKLTQLRKAVTARDFRVRELEDGERELQDNLQSARDETDRLRDSEGSEFYSTQRELQVVRGDKERMAIDLEKAKKLLETTHQRLRQVEVKYQAELRSAEERAGQEAESGEGLRVELQARDRQVEAMGRSLQELGQRNQELLEQSLMVKEAARHAHHATPPDPYNLQADPALTRRFMQQLGLCFTELQAMVTVCSQRSQGQDPDISVLLTVPRVDDDAGGAAGQSMGHWMTKLGELRKEVDRLRAHICNKYAEDMGDNINCATQ